MDDNEHWEEGESGDSRAPDYASTITGWKAWNQGTYGNKIRLQSGMGSVWSPDPLKAVCINLPHSAPREDCSCGIYATRTMEQLLRNWWHREGMILGKVALWGKVIIHHEGYRAEWAQPLEIWVPRDKVGWVPDLMIYNIPISIGYPFRTREELYAELELARKFTKGTKGTKFKIPQFMTNEEYDHYKQRLQTPQTTAAVTFTGRTPRELAAQLGVSDKAIRRELRFRFGNLQSQSRTIRWNLTDEEVKFIVEHFT